MCGKPSSPDGPITIKKYANRRLYNTATSSYVTLDHLSRMVKDGEEFVVVDARTGDDITRSVLTQIIFEEESKGQNLLPIQFLRQLIRFYGDQMATVVPRYLEISMEAFAHNQEQMRNRMAEALGGAQQPFKLFEEMTRQNVALFQEAWADAYKRMMSFSPPGATRARPPEPGEPREERPAASQGEGSQAELRELREELAAMKRKVDRLSGKDE
ncbi:MAG: polyhydroxyalkanoate synthesis repressor PhaR [Alphaproteobacteria bacterium]